MSIQPFLKRYLILRIVVFTFCFGFIQCNKDTTKPEPEMKPFVIENLGVTFGAWDEETNLAGDFYFSRDFQKIFSEFGAQVLDPDWNIKELPTFDYVIRNNQKYP